MKIGWLVVEAGFLLNPFPLNCFKKPREFESISKPRA
jgi:hypothetical protein